MLQTLQSLAPHVLGMTRILVGVLLMCHGAQKLFGAFGGPPPGAPPAVVSRGTAFRRAGHVTDEDLRLRFIADPRATLRLAQQGGLVLTACGIDARLASPIALRERLAATLGPRPQKATSGANRRGDAR